MRSAQFLKHVKIPFNGENCRFWFADVFTVHYSTLGTLLLCKYYKVLIIILTVVMYVQELSFPTGGLSKSEGVHFSSRCCELL